jgi:hypothetical protein
MTRDALRNGHIRELVLRNAIAVCWNHKFRGAQSLSDVELVELEPQPVAALRGHVSAPESRKRIAAGTQAAEPQA